MREIMDTVWRFFYRFTYCTRFGHVESYASYCLVCGKGLRK